MDSKGVIFSCCHYYKKNVIFSSYQLGKLIKNVGGNDFLPRKLNLIKKLRDFFNGKINKFTINNVVIFKKLKYINLIRENRNIQFGLKVFKNKTVFFDNRFLILSKFNGILVSNNDHSNILKLPFLFALFFYLHVYIPLFLSYNPLVC